MAATGPHMKFPKRTLSVNDFCMRRLHIATDCAEYDATY